MAVDKNFVVKHGLEVNGDLILANALTNRVGIATTVPNYTLHVNGGIGATDLKVLGIATIPQLVLTGTVRAANSIGLPEQYLKSTGSGVEWEDFPVGRTSGTFTASPGQTTFSFTYSVGLVDIFINGVKLTPSEFTATDAVSIVLTNPCFGGEVVDIHAYSVRGLGVGATGITGLTIQDEGTMIGNPQGVTSINFVGVGLTASATGAAVTVSLTDQWYTTTVGIHTLKNVGIATTNPRFSLEVGPVGYAGTALWVNGNARITGILTVGTSSIIINGSTDTLTVPNLVVTNSTTGVTASGVAITIRDGGGDLGSASIIDFGDNISVNLASGIATITGSAGSSSQWVSTTSGIHTLSNVGIGTTNPGEKLQVDGNIRVGISTTSNYIAFRGTYWDGPANTGGELPYQHTYIGERIYDYSGNGERSELLLFKGNDISGADGPDRIRLLSGEHRFDIIGFNTTGTFEQVGVSTAAVNKLTITSTGVGIGTTNPTSALTVKGNTSLETLNVSGVSTFRDNVNFGTQCSISTSGNSLTISADGDITLASWQGSTKITSQGGANLLSVGAASGDVSLYYQVSAGPSGSEKRLQTLGTGVTITGTTFTNQLNVSGISTLGNTIVGGATTQLVVNGDARITGVLTVGSSSITLDGASDTIRVGSGITINGSTGRVDATDFYASGLQVGVLTATTIIYQGATLYNVWQQTGVGINTLSNVGIGTTNPTSSLTVKGNTSLETLNVSGVSTFTGNIAISGSATINNLIIQQSGLNGSGNIAIGDINTLGSSVGSNYNIAIGQEALDNVKSGDYNIAIGYQAAQNNNISDSNYGSNVAIGYQAFKNVRASSNNVAIGYQALLGSSGSYDTIQTVAIGANAGYNVQDTRFGSFFGHQAGYSQTSADYNTFLGYNSGYSVTTGSNNVIIGSYTGNQNGLDIRTSSNNVVLSDGSGNIRFYANSSGNIGLGTINPIGRLQVGSATTNTNLFLITNAGDVGIGTTNPEHFDGFGILTLDGKDYQYLGNTLSGGGNIIFKSKGNKTLDIYSYTDNIGGIGTATNIDLHYGLYIQQPSGTSIVSLTKSGNVGIGTTNPTSALTVSGNVSVSGVSTFNGSDNYFIGNIICSTYAGTSRTILTGGTGGNTNLYNGGTSYSDFIFTAFQGGASREIARINKNGVLSLPYADGGLNVVGVSTFVGNVGIGTTNATSKLTVRGGDISVGVSTAHGVILTSPNGTQYRLIVANDGTLSTTAV